MKLNRRDFNSMALGAAAAQMLAGSVFAKGAAESGSVSELASLSLADAAAKIRSGAVTSTALTQACLDRIEVYQPKLDAFITVMKSQALAAAAQLDAERRQVISADLCMACR